MEYEDPLYGRVRITEPVLLDLLDTDAVRRLQGILQHGITGLIGVTQPQTRWTHSMGVMLLIRRMGGDVREQIAGLLHDISHTAFSHVIDYVVDGHHSQSFHDEMKEQYVAQTELPDVLARHGFDWRDFLNEADFPLLEQAAPRLCADRLDYLFRDAVELRLATPATLHANLETLVVHDGRLACNNLEAARWLAYTYMAADDASWANFREVGLYELTARAIRRALQVGVIDESDFWGQDRDVWQRLHRHEDRELQGWLALVSPDTRFVWDEQAPTFRVGTKVRTIDPDVVHAGKLVPLSQLDPFFAQQRQQYARQKEGKWPMRVIGPVVGNGSQSQL